MIEVLLMAGSLAFISIALARYGVMAIQRGNIFAGILIFIFAGIIAWPLVKIVLDRFNKKEH